MVKLILMVLAVICFVLAAFPVSIGKTSIGWFGLAFWAFATII